MKWFQVDADTPNDPKVRAIVRELGAAGMGGLFFIWCHIADHGIRKPGWSLDSLGRPMPLTELVDASRLNESEFSKLALICTSSGHWLKKPWDTRQVIAIPAMARRADTYTKRRVRTHVEDDSNEVRTNFANKTRQHSTNKQGRRERRDIRDSKTCGHEPRCSSRHACVERTITDGRRKSA